MGGGGGSFLDLGGSRGPLCEVDFGVFGGEFSCDGVLVEGILQSPVCGVVVFVLGLGLGGLGSASSASVVQ